MPIHQPQTILGRLSMVLQATYLPSRRQTIEVSVNADFLLFSTPGFCLSNDSEYTNEPWLLPFRQHSAVKADSVK